MRKLIIAVMAMGVGYAAAPALSATALFAGGCFWSVEANFDKVEGVTRTVSGFAGGALENPTYEQVAYRGGTGHYETVEITYDPEVVSYEELLTVLWHSSDPTDAGGQFCDRGETYRHAVFALDSGQEEAVRASIAAMEAETGYTFVTEIREAARFWPAGDEHQNFHAENPQRYEAYRIGCGRDRVIGELWGDDAFLGTSENPFPR